MNADVAPYPRRRPSPSVPFVPPIVQPPTMRVADIRADEKPVEVEKKETVAAANDFFARVKASFVFTNPNARAMEGELEFPIPEGAIVCGYALEVNGEMIPGVVCDKEKARVAFENEVRKGVDPGIVEHVKGNIWKTRIFPLNPKTPRRAEVEYVTPRPLAKDGAEVVVERDGDDYFIATVSKADERRSVADKIAEFRAGTVLWDASMSAKPFAAAWRKRLEALPENGEWKLVAFRNKPDGVRSFSSRADLLAAIDALIYDGGTDIARAVGCAGDAPALLFTDEVDTLGLEDPKYEGLKNLTIASRDDVAARAVEVRKLASGEEKPRGHVIAEGRILATVWAARRMQDLASQAGSRKKEFLDLGRKYGVAGPGLSLIVLERLDQWLEYKIEPPKNLSIHAEWARRRAAEDDPIAEKKARAEHEKMLLQYWEERVKWWKDPKPRRETPKSGLFDGIARAFGGGSRRNSSVAEDGMAAPAAAAMTVAAMDVSEERAPGSAARMRSAPRMAMASAPMAESAKASVPRGAAGSGAAPTVTLKAWDPKTPYIDALKAADKGEAYKVYLKEREKYSSSPAFYLDCAGWFFKAGEASLAERIVSNLAEFKLEDPALWRTMGWRLREAGRYDLAVRVFRKVLKMRGEEAQSRRDLALVLMERGKELAAKDAKGAKQVLEEAMRRFAEAAFHVNARRSGRRGNDFQVSIVALEELNGLISWADDRKWGKGKKPREPRFDSAYRRDLPMKLRIVMSWDADQTDIDLHVLEPNGEEAFYGHRRTAEGGFVSEDVTTGYGPEEYLKKELEPGTYKVLSNYFASHQTALTGATTVTATVYTDWGTAQEKRQVLTLRLDKPKDKHLIGEVTL